ncbi:hypothetical protein [Mesorhizobium captivum]|uniref:hypothetical protein n=1 Tax=Mesorhizobium captivum TaxID=3072319 RepID=UPI002A249653|nr:hypothetical protein [Mesorhizobium sp. VK3C]MDX8445331.1 hypothetical protein [Mesorhizobium sp. VK3C]
MGDKPDGNKAIRAVWLKAMADEGDEIGVFAHIVRMLWRSHDPERRVAAQLLLRYAKTGRFLEVARGPMGRPPGPVKCKRTPTGERRAVEVPRNEIALSVFLRLEPGPLPLIGPREVSRELRRRGLGDAIAKTARFFGISEDVARDCFEAYRDELLRFGDVITWS